MSVVKREKWTEAEVDALPPGEHDYFERKAGKLFAGTDDILLAKVAKAVSALANSGGGHLLLGVEDKGTFDGVPPMHKGNTATRDWLEQVVPRLVDYPLADFRVHVVEPTAGASRIPAGRQIIVVDVGDSAMAPHQCMRSGADARAHIYYYRQAGRSEPAPHFYLELLRQRLMSPVLEASPQELRLVKAGPVDNNMFLALRLRFLVRNVGRVAAYKWALRLVHLRGGRENRREDYRLSPSQFPPLGRMDGGLRIDDTILPDCALSEDLDFGVVLRARPRTPNEYTAEIEHLLLPATLGYRLATETSPGETQEVVLLPFVKAGWGSTVHSHLPPGWD